MQAIITHFIPCTNFKESRVKAVCEAGSLTLGWNDADGFLLIVLVKHILELSGIPFECKR